MSSGSAITDVTFRVPAQQTPANVSAFGVVFVDVERSGSAILEAYDASGTLLGRFAAPVMKAGGPHSFVGVRFQSALVARVRITSGDAALSALSRDLSDGGATDLVVMDDFVYAEPQPRI
jgi:hypothetical protein